MQTLSRTHSRFAGAVLAFFAALALTFSLGAAPAAAAPGPNETLIELDPVLKIGLSVAKIKVEPTGATKHGGAGLYYPVTNAFGMKDTFVGTLRHQGGFQLRLGGMRIGFKNFVVKTSAKTPVSGVLNATPVFNGMALPFEIPFSDVRLTSVRQQHGMTIALYKLSADADIVNLINKTLGVKLLTPGAPWASVETRIKRPAATTPVATTPPVVTTAN